MKVKEVMKQPYVIEKDVTLNEVAKIMSSKQIGSLIYLVDGRIKGIITDTDLVRNYGSREKVSGIMSKNVITVNSNDNIENAAELMRKNNIKRLPVLEKDRLVGIITVTELIAHSDELEEEFFFDD
jgi:CBS domain-containing protein